MAALKHSVRPGLKDAQKVPAGNDKLTVDLIWGCGLGVFPPSQNP